MATEQIRRHRFTADEYHLMGAAGVIRPEARVELIEGEVLERSPIGREHMAKVDRINHHFSKRFGGRAIVSVQNSVRLGRHSEPQPDLALLRPRPDYYQSADHTPADVLLLVEVADTTAKSDRALKIPLYAKSGIVETWLVDLSANVIEVYRRPGPDGYALVTRVGRGETLAVEAFPGEVLPAEELLG